jgi:hypothetical protein
MNSIIGLKPYEAAPTPIPVNPISEIGVSIILLSPNFFHKSFEILYAPLYCATSSPIIILILILIFYFLILLFI